MALRKTSVRPGTMRTTMNRQYYSYSPSQSSKKSRFPKLVAVLLISILTVGLVAKILGLTPSSGEQGDAAASVQPVKPPVKPVDETTMQSKITQIIAQYPELQIGVSIVDLENGNAYNYGVTDAPFIGASTTKVLTASLFLRHVEQGKASLSETIDGTNVTTLLRKMIIESDNTAWSSLNSFLGKDVLQKYATEIGMLHYDPANNSLTTPDMALLLQKLHNRDLINDQHTSLLLSYMHEADIRDYIVEAVGESAQVYHKAGYLKDRVLDAAIIDNGKHPYVLVIFSKASDAYDQTAEKQLFGDITRATLELFRK